MGTRASTKSFRELIVWQRSIELATAVYRASASFPKEEIYGLTSQIRRCAVSIPSNIAEGQGRLSTGEFRHFLGIARGSNFELQTQITIARELGIGDRQRLDAVEALSHEVGKMIYTILNKLNAGSSDH